MGVPDQVGAKTQNRKGTSPSAGVLFPIGRLTPDRLPHCVFAAHLQPRRPFEIGKKRTKMRKVVVITGAGAGVGRAVASEFARNGCDVALLSRDPDRLERAAAELRQFGVRALPIPTDVADAKAVDAAAERIEGELGPIDVWVNVAMATVFAPVHKLAPEEFQRGTAVTYLGQVHGTMAALRYMRPRNRGSIVCVGSALAYRSVPLQSVYCGAKFAIRGFLGSLRSELYHDKINVTLTEVDLPAVNTPQFDWARNKTGHKAQPVPPIYQPEVVARAIFFGAFNPRRQIWVGFPTVKAILANRIAPGLLDRYLAKFGYTGQLSDQPSDPNAPGNLFEPVTGAYGAHGRFDDQARTGSWEMVASRHHIAAWAVAFVGVAIGAHLLAKLLKI
ncbi:MAG TPA: SDR family oxidoreductase [Bryobacteraceae bacterium]|nr:SDR family oxidoreductase [Bryobacteraceae bacterium]